MRSRSRRTGRTSFGRGAGCRMRARLWTPPDREARIEQKDAEGDPKRRAAGSEPRDAAPDRGDGDAENDQRVAERPPLERARGDHDDREGAECVRGDRKETS